MKTLYPEIPMKSDESLTESEKKAIADAIVAGWEAPEEVAPFKAEVMNRLLYGVANALGLTAMRKTAIKGFLYKVEEIDKQLFCERDKMIEQIGTTMSAETSPKDKAALDTTIVASTIPVAKFTQKFMDNQVGKKDATWVEFKKLYTAEAIPKGL